eukprot:scaffold16508_cov108-Isochrysis_galbana.AAC.5
MNPRLRFQCPQCGSAPASGIGSAPASTTTTRCAGASASGVKVGVDDQLPPGPPRRRRWLLCNRPLLVELVGAAYSCPQNSMPAPILVEAYMCRQDFMCHVTAPILLSTDLTRGCSFAYLRVHDCERAYSYQQDFMPAPILVQGPHEGAYLRQQDFMPAPILVQGPHEGAYLICVDKTSCQRLFLSTRASRGCLFASTRLHASAHSCPRASRGCLFALT